MLIESASGYFTGSIYGDSSIASDLNAEKNCGMRMIAIKAHPMDLTVSNMQILFKTKNPKKKCKHGAVLGFRRAIILVREPYAAILAQSQLSGISFMLQ